MPLGVTFIVNFKLSAFIVKFEIYLSPEPVSSQNHKQVNQNESDSICVLQCTSMLTHEPYCYKHDS